MNPFKIELNGFGSFANPKNPVIYIHPEISSELQDLYQRVKQQFSFAPTHLTLI